MNEKKVLEKYLKSEFKHLCEIYKSDRNEFFNERFDSEEAYVADGIRRWEESDLLKDNESDLETETYIDSLDEKTDFSTSPEVDKEILEAGLGMLTTESEKENSSINWSRSSKNIVVASGNARIEIPIDTFIIFVKDYMMTIKEISYNSITVRWSNEQYKKNIKDS